MIVSKKNQEPTLLVSGASGALAQLVIRNLLDVHGVAPERIIAVTRSPRKLAPLAERGIAVRKGDFDAPEALVEAFTGADRALIISVDADPLESYLSDTDPVGNPQRRRVLRQVGAVNSAERAGVEHLLYTSAPNPDPPTVCFWKRDHWHTEQAIRASPMSWSILRMWEYPDFHLTYSWAQALGSGEFFAASGNGRCAFIAREDCARAAAAALASSNRENRVYDITGRDALAIDEVMAMLSRINRRLIRVLHLTPEQLLEHLKRKGEELAPVLTAFQHGMAQGKYDRVSSDFAELTGRKPASLEDFLRKHPVSEEQMKVRFRFGDHAT
jgi:NAD(P)H dehydrogenase (quinone)